MAKLAVPQTAINEFCAKNQIRRLALFGSVLRDDFRADSDIDIVVEFLPGRRIGMLAMARMERELAQLFGGKKIDLRTPAELSRYFRAEVLKNAQVCYDS